MPGTCNQTSRKIPRKPTKRFNPIKGNPDARRWAGVQGKNTPEPLPGAYVAAPAVKGSASPESSPGPFAPLRAAASGLALDHCFR